ncbi:hypothetical protein BJ878DRAFT_136781 [Calycina marina]|uniref:Uncharacterized protein n=1 Tax=Calycina marina TaxID=1763456 RepID=A0A9P7Z1C1_9HELO|nr:hypothetical protein BJ878DRAFT_136781 [Calycina marina]
MLIWELLLFLVLRLIFLHRAPTIWLQPTIDRATGVRYLDLIMVSNCQTLQTIMSSDSAIMILAPDGYEMPSANAATSRPNAEHRPSYVHKQNGQIIAIHTQLFRYVTCQPAPSCFYNPGSSDVPNDDAEPLGEMSEAYYAFNFGC